MKDAELLTILKSELDSREAEELLEFVVKRKRVNSAVDKVKELSKRVDSNDYQP